jgi:hypothetical protein
VWAQIKNVATGSIRSLINRARLTIGLSLALDLSPEMIHGIQFWCGSWQEAKLNAQLRRHALTRCGSMGRTAIFKQYYAPATPVGTDHPQKRLVSFLDPLVSNQQQYIATPGVEHAMENSPGSIPCDQDAFLLADVTVAIVQGRCLGEDGLIQHQRNRAFTGKQSVF